MADSSLAAVSGLTAVPVPAPAVGPTTVPRMAATGAVTIVDVARRAGVSRQTVTRALNGLPDVSAATRSLVVNAARELNYRPNRAAQRLVRGRDLTVGLITEDLQNPYYAELASAVGGAAAEKGWSTVLGDLGGTAVRAQRTLDSMLQRVDALLLTGCRDAAFQLLAAAGGNSPIAIPTVALDGVPEDPVDAIVEIDHDAGMRTALDHLAGLGRERIVFLDSEVARPGRRSAFRNWRLDRGLPEDPDAEIRTPETYGAAQEAVAGLLARHPRPDAIMAYNDLLALGVLKGLARAGVSVPGDVAVIGVDGLGAGTYGTPELTTLAIDKAALARAAVSLVERLLSEPLLPGTQERLGLELSLVVRESG